MSVTSEIAYGHIRPVAAPFADAVARLESALQAEGFGVLFRIDMQAKLREKLGVEFSAYMILGACLPKVAHEALQHEIGLGLLLPCNAVVYEKDGTVHVGTIDANRMLSIVGNPAMEPMARLVDEKLRRAVDRAAA